MTNEEIIALAREVADQDKDDPVRHGLITLTYEEMERFAAAVIKRHEATQVAAAVAKAESEISNLHTVMMAAAVEITEHWDAHCDEEGYGPANLVRRLENGYPAQYGYDAQTVVRMEKRIEALESTLKEALKTLESKYIIGCNAVIKQIKEVLHAE